MFKKLVWLSSFALFLGCGDSGKPALEQAIGATGKINIIIPGPMWNSNVGAALDSLLTREMTVLPRPENIFKIRQVNPDEVNHSMKRTRNLLFVLAYNDKSPDTERIKKYLSPNSLNKLMTDTSRVFEAVSNVFARNQEVMFLFAPDTKSLVQKIRTKGQKIIDHFEHKERERFTKNALNASGTKQLTARVKEKFKASIQLPFGYRKADDTTNFIWFRQINPLDDKDVFIARKRYTSQSDFKKENLIAFRNEICKRYIFEDPEEPDTYLITETQVDYKPVEWRELNFNGRYAAELRGLWKTNISTMGGPFKGIALVDEKRGYFYYVEGFAYGPSKDLRELMRELDAILYSFKLE